MTYEMSKSSEMASASGSNSAGSLKDSQRRSDDATDSRAMNPVNAARSLKHDAEELQASVSEIARPFTSYAILSNIAAAGDLLAHSLGDLASWHARAEDGTHFQDVDGVGAEGTRRAAERLREAEQLVHKLRKTLHEALDESSKVRWLDAPTIEESASMSEAPTA